MVSIYNEEEETVTIKNGKLQFTFDVSYDDSTPPMVKEFLQGLKAQARANNNQYQCQWRKNMEAALKIEIPATKNWKLNESTSYGLEI